MTKVLRESIKMNKKKSDSPTDMPTAEKEISGEEIDSELSEPLWSVITFDECAASGLKYIEAVKILLKLEAQKVSGLCIVTDEAAARMSARKK